MKKSLSILTVVCLFIAVQLSAQTKDAPFLTRSLKESVKYVAIETVAGGILVNGITSGEPRLEMYVRTTQKENNLTKEEIQKKLDEDYTIEITTSDEKLVAIIKHKDNLSNRRKTLSISFEAYVPQNVSTDLNSSGGSISISNLSGEQNFATNVGSLHVEHVTGDITGRTSGGSIVIMDASTNIDLETNVGSISAKNCTGKIKLHTSGGSLLLENLDGNIEARTSAGSIVGQNLEGEINTHTSGGNIQFENMSGSLDASTTAGNIDVEINKLGKHLTLENSGGSIYVKVPANQRLDLNLKGRKVNTPELSNFSGALQDDELTGKLNGGGVPITVKGNGNVRLAFK